MCSFAATVRMTCFRAAGHVVIVAAGESFGCACCCCWGLDEDVGIGAGAGAAVELRRE
jgi:hypothetical protein